VYVTTVCTNGFAVVTLGGGGGWNTFASRQPDIASTIASARPDRAAGVLMTPMLATFIDSLFLIVTIPAMYSSA
jgi:hypothetical protein